MGVTLASTPCDYCRESYKVGGFQRAAHLRKHVREGLLVEVPNSQPLEFTETAKGTARRREISDWRMTGKVITLLRERGVSDLAEAERLLAVDQAQEGPQAGTPRWARRWWQKRREHVHAAFVAAWNESGDEDTSDGGDQG